MKAIKDETAFNAAESEEMQKFYRALAAVQRNSIFHLMSATDAEEMKALAKEITPKLIKVANLIAPPSRGNRCEPGTIWNPITKICE